MGCGSSPRSLSPATDIWRPAPPVECRRLSVSRRCAGLHGRLQAAPTPQRSRPSVSPPWAFRVRLLSPGFAHLPARPPGPGSDAVENGCIRSTDRKVGIGPSGPDRWPCATGLASYPSSCVSFLVRTTPFSAPPAIRILLRFRGHRRSPDAFRSDRAIRGDPVPFHPPVATPGRFSGFSCRSSRTAGSRTTTLAHSSNFRSMTDCVRPKVRNPGHGGRDSARGRFPRPAPL
jgi:hypothetical protein